MTRYSCLAKRTPGDVFTAGDSREPELAGIRSALTGSLLTLLVTLVLSFPIGVAAVAVLAVLVVQALHTNAVFGVADALFPGAAGHETAGVWKVADHRRFGVRPERLVRRESIVSSTIDAAIENVLGITGQELYDEWAAKLREEYTRRIEPVLANRADKPMLGAMVAWSRGIAGGIPPTVTLPYQVAERGIVAGDAGPGLIRWEEIEGAYPPTPDDGESVQLRLKVTERLSRALRRKRRQPPGRRRPRPCGAPPTPTCRPSWPSGGVC